MQEHDVRLRFDRDIKAAVSKAIEAGVHPDTVDRDLAALVGTLALREELKNRDRSFNPTIGGTHPMGVGVVACTPDDESEPYDVSNHGRK